MSGLNHSAVAFRFQEQSFLLWCSSFMVMVVNIIISTLTWRVEVWRSRGRFHMSDDQRWVWTWWNMNDTPQALYFSFAHSWVFLPAYPKLWLNLVYISGPSQVALSWCQWLLSILTRSLWATKSTVGCRKELRLCTGNSVVLWELLTVPWTAIAYKRQYKPLLLSFKEQETIKDPMIIIGPW